jgi:threonine aldolase
MFERWPEVAEDHRRARRLAECLGGIPGFAGERPATNIVLLRPGAGRSPASVCEALARAGVLALPFGADRVRFVTYRGLSDDDIDAAAEAIRAALGADTDVEAVAS